MTNFDSQFSKNEVGEIFDNSASYYSDERGQAPGLRAQLKIVLEMLDAGAGVLLDVGCAAGAEVEAFRARNFRVLGIDYSPEMLRLAHRRFREDAGVTLFRADAESLPFAPSTFDYVVSMGVFEYLSTYDLCLSEIHRVLRPDGVAIISIPTRISLDRFSYNLCSTTVVPVWRGIKKLMGKPSAGQPLGRRWNRCIPWKFHRLLRRHGFEPEDSAYSGFIVFPLEEIWPAAQNRLFWLMERFSRSPVLRWTLSQYLVRARKLNSA